MFLCVPARVCVYKDLCKERNKMESAIDLLHCVSVHTMHCVSVKNKMESAIDLLHCVYV